VPFAGVVVAVAAEETPPWHFGEFMGTASIHNTYLASTWHKKDIPNTKHKYTICITHVKANPGTGTNKS
jgi:hypothetical protein